MSTLSNLDYILINMYKSMIGINNLQNDKLNNTIVLGSLNINANLNITGNIIFNNSITTLNNLNLSYSIFNNITITNNLYSNNIIFNTVKMNNLNINSNLFNNLFISNLSIINNNLSINSTLTISGISILPNINQYLLSIYALIFLWFSPIIWHCRIIILDP